MRYNSKSIFGGYMHIEGPGHVPMHVIKENMELQLK